MEIGDQKAQDARVQKLWQTLDTQNQGHLDVKGLKKGLKKIDHRSSVTETTDRLTLIYFTKLSRMPMICYKMSLLPSIPTATVASNIPVRNRFPRHLHPADLRHLQSSESSSSRQRKNC